MSEGTGGRTAWIGVVLAVMSAAFVMVKTGRDALYFLDDSLTHLPWAYLTIAAASGPVALVTLRLMRRFGPRRVRSALPAFTAIVLAAYHPFAVAGSGFVPLAFFAFVPLVWGVMFSTAWLMGSELLEGRRRAEIALSYARIGGATIGGGIVGGASARVVASLCTPSDLLLFGSGLLLLVVAMIGYVHHRYPVRQTAGEPEERVTVDLDAPPRARSVLADPYARSMLVVASIAGAVGVLIEYQFYYAVSALSVTGSQNIRLFASVYMILSAVALVFQLWVTPRLQNRAGVEGSLMVLPSGLLVGASALVIGGGTLVLRSILRMAEGGLKSSVHRSNWEQAYLGLPRARRSTAKVLIDGMGSRIGEALAAATLILVARLGAVHAAPDHPGVGWVTWPLVAASVVWILVTARMRRRRTRAGEAHGVGTEPCSVPIPDS